MALWNLTAAKAALADVDYVLAQRGTATPSPTAARPRKRRSRLQK